MAGLVASVKGIVRIAHQFHNCTVFDLLSYVEISGCCEKVRGIIQLWESFFHVRI